MRSVILLALLAPGAAAWSATIEAPAAWGEGLPFLAVVCAEADGGRAQMRVLAENAALDVPEARYLPPFDARECREFVVTPGNGTVLLEARVRAEGKDAVKARAYANVTLLDSGVAIVAAESAAFAPALEGWALVPALDDASAVRLRIVEARAPPLEGIVLANDGAGAVPLAPLRVDGAPFSAASIAPGASLFVPIDVRAGALRLTAGARVLDELVVPKLRAGEGTLGRYGRTHAPAQWETLDEVTIHEASVAPVVALIDAAREEVLVEAYTLTSPDVASALARAADRGARVRVLLEGAPVGGVPADERALVATLLARGAEVIALGGEGARYRTVHSKLVVVDRASASVATENLGEMSARGFGLIVRDVGMASRIGALIEADLVGHDVAPFETSEPPAEALATIGFSPDTLSTGGARGALVLSPDDPRALADAVRGARESVDVMMLRAEADGAMIDALVAAAREGARVRVRLDARYDDGTNRETAARLNALAAREALLLNATLDPPGQALHAKMFVVDARSTYIGSMNWVRAAWEDNREAGLLVESEEIAAWATEEFEKDGWEGPRGREVVREVPALPWMFVWFALALTRRRARGGRAGAPCRTCS